VRAVREFGEVSGHVFRRLGKRSGPVWYAKYFVVAEALTNIAKHARAGRAEVTARVQDGRLAVQVRDPTSSLATASRPLDPRL
jgi:glucose-6-phosphate-specific signal transduction histidine kinase